MKVVGILLVVLALFASGAAAKIHGEEVKYSGGGVDMRGYISYDDQIEGKRPGILVVHEWWGHNSYARMRADELAELGYTALAVDMYGDGKQATHPEDAMKFTSEVMKNMDVAKARFLAALDVLKKHKTVDPDRVAAIGYCFGGGVVLQMARLGVDLDAVVSFHGSLATMKKAKKGDVKAAVLVCNGEADPFTTTEQIEAFKKEMEEAGVHYKFISYKGAKHSFTNKDADAMGKKFNLPLAYNAEADKQSWKDMQDFLKEVFQK